jgi:adenylate cyclase
MERVLRQEPRNLDAYDCLKRGQWHLVRFTKDDCATARSLFERAAELDPRSAEVYASLAGAHYQEIFLGWTESPAESTAEMVRAARTSVALDDKYPWAQNYLGIAYRVSGEPEKAIAVIELAIELNPSLASAYYNLGATLALVGRPDEAIPNFEKAIRLSPHDPGMWLFLNGIALAHTAARRFEEAIHWAQRSLQRRPDWLLAHLVLAGGYAQLDRSEEARSALQEALQLQPALSLSAIRMMAPGADPAFIELAVDGLRKAGLKE